jgi:hypothetical protein
LQKLIEKRVAPGVKSMKLTSDQLNAQTYVGRVFGTPILVKGKSWLPVAQIVAWPVMAWLAKRRLPERSWWKCLGIGALTMPVALGSEWCHNLAHAAAARWIGKPMDALHIIGGMPRVEYRNINDQTVTPRQHILRAMGGPLFNLLILPLALLLRRFTPAESVGRDIAEVAIGMNALIPTAGLLPIPGLDGGPILKWALVDRGDSPTEADRKVRKVNGGLGILLGLTGGWALKKHHWTIGGLLLFMGVIALGVASGKIKEKSHE